MFKEAFHTEMTVRPDLHETNYVICDSRSKILRSDNYNCKVFILNLMSPDLL